MKPLFGERYQVLIIDWANLVARAFSIRGTTPTDFGTLFLEMLFKLQRTYPGYELVFALEGKGTKRRRKLYPEYKKGSRKPQNRPKEFDQLAVKTIGCIKCKVIVAPDGEADDAIATFMKQNLTSTDASIIVSEDRDLYQLVRDPNIKIHTRSGRLLDELGVFTKLKGLQPREVPLYKSLMGDKSDNIPKVPSLGRKSALAVVQNQTSLKQVFKRVRQSADLLPLRHRDAILANKKLVKTNMKLVHLKGEDQLMVNSKKSKPNRLHKLLQAHGIWKWSKSELATLTKGTIIL